MRKRKKWEIKWKNKSKKEKRRRTPGAEIDRERKCLCVCQVRIIGDTERLIKGNIKDASRLRKSQTHPPVAVVPQRITEAASASSGIGFGATQIIICIQRCVFLCFCFPFNSRGALVGLRQWKTITPPDWNTRGCLEVSCRVAACHLRGSIEGVVGKNILRGSWEVAKGRESHEQMTFVADTKETQYRNARLLFDLLFEYF